MATSKVNSYERKAGISSEDVEIVNGDRSFSIDDTASGKDILGQMEISTDKVYANEDLEREAFMAQELEVHIMDAGSEDDPQFVEVTVNGDYRLARRGDTVTLKRYHVAVLAQGKELRMRQVKIVNPDGSMGYEEKMVSKQTYPFSVIHDPAGRKGSDWLRQQLRNP